jgi:tape measure domain-containing protein
MRLQTLMTGGLFGMAALSIAKTADAMQGLENQVRLVTQGEEQREEVQRRLLVIANKNFADIEATTGSYQRNAFALAQLGKSQMDVLNFTDALSLAMRTGGRSMVEQKSAVYQLSQAMGAGKLMGDEFRALSENAPIILKYIAKEMGVAQGALKALSSEGKITSEIIYNAMMKARPEMEKMAQSLPITMSQAWQQVNNSYKTFIDNFMNGTDGMSQGIASMLQGVGKNFDTVIKGMTIAGGLAFIGLASKIDIATKSMALFNFVANANPFVRMATIILAVSSAFYGLDDVINTTSVIMGDLIHMITDGWTGIFNLIGDGLNSLQGVVAQNNDDIGKSYKDMFTNATTDHDKFIANATFASNNLVKTISTDNMKNEQSYFGFYSRTQKGFLGFVEFVGTAVIAAVSTLGGFFKFIFNGIEDTLKRMGNALMTAEEWIQKKLGNNVQHKRYDTFNNLSADQSYADVNSAGQKWWQDNFIMPLSGQVRQKEIATGGIPQSMYAPIDPNAKPPSSSDINDKKKKAHDLLKGEIADAIQWAAADLKIRPNDLAAVISFETRGTFSPAVKNPNSSATGLIQFMEDKYKSYGYTRNEFAALGANEQMKYVVQYLKGRGIGQGSGLGDIYDAVAGYGYRDGNPKYNKKGQRVDAYYLNRVWDANRDGYVAKGEAVTAKAFQPHIKNYFPNGINLQDVGKVETDLAKNQAALDKAREEYITSIATGEAKINAQLNKAIADLPSKGFSGQALEDEKKRLTEEAEFDRLLFRETNRQKLDELMAVHKAKKDQILDESYLQGLTIAADESKSREQRKTELEALDVGTKEKIRLNDIANKYELNQIYAYRKTSSELIADEWDEKIDALRQYTGEYKEEWRKAYEEQRKIALENDKLVNQQKLLDINVANLTEIDLIMKRAELEQKILDNTPNISPEMYNAQSADIKRKQANGVFDVREKSANNYLAMISGFHGLGKNYEANKAAEDNKKANFGILDSALQNGILSSEAQQKGITEYELYLERVKEINEKFKIDTEITLIGGYQSIFGGMADILKMFGGESRKSYMMLLAAQKGYVLQAAFLNNKKAISDAWATDGNYFTKAIAVGKVILQNQEIMSAITSFSPKGFSTGGYTGNMGVNDIAGVVHGKEYVLNAAATKRIGVDNLNAMNKGASIGNNNVSVNVVVNADGSSDVQSNAQMGKQMGDAIKAAVLQTIVQEKRQGGLLSR